MGRCLAEAALALGHEVVIVSGPVLVEYPEQATLIPVISTEDMLEVAEREFANCDGLIGAAAPCDYRPIEVADHKIRKTGEVLQLKLVETPDVVATLGAKKRADQWTVGFALETEDARFRALAKLERKCCDLVVLNGVSAINSTENEVELIEPGGQVVKAIAGSKQEVAKQLLATIQQRLIK